MKVYLFRLNNKGVRTQTIGVMSLADAERAIERGTSRLIAVDCETGAVIAAAEERDMTGDWQGIR